MSTDTLRAYGVTEKGLNIVEREIPLRQPGPDEVLLRVLYSGVCASDIHQMTGDWASHGVDLITDNPFFVPGHEAISIVVKLGSNVTSLKLFDRVGCGPQRAGCFECPTCEAGDEHVCDKNAYQSLYGRHNNGSLGQYLTVNARLCTLVPDGIPSNCAPLCCAGLTTFTPLHRMVPSTPSEIAVIGIGGLGSLAVAYAAGLGHTVTAFTTNLSKTDEIKAMGATHVAQWSGAGVKDDPLLIPYKLKFDAIINTVSAPIDCDGTLRCLKPQGTLIFCGISNQPINVNPFSILGAGIQRTIRGSFIGGTRDMRDMFAFSQEKNILPILEVVPAPFGQNNQELVAESIKRVHEGKVRYRLVLDYQVDVEQLKKDVLATASQ